MQINHGVSHFSIGFIFQVSAGKNLASSTRCQIRNHKNGNTMRKHISIIGNNMFYSFYFSSKSSRENANYIACCCSLRCGKSAAPKNRTLYITMIISIRQTEYTWRTPQFHLSHRDPFLVLGAKVSITINEFGINCSSILCFCVRKTLVHVWIQMGPEC